MNYFIDCEFDGHNGPLLSFAIIRENDNEGLHIRTMEIAHLDPWVVKNVAPNLANCPVKSRFVPVSDVGRLLLAYIGDDPRPTIISDSPVDTARFCHAITNTSSGKWNSVDRSYSFVAADVDIDEYFKADTDAVRHNAWWDAVALKALLDED